MGPKTDPCGTPRELDWVRGEAVDDYRLVSVRKVRKKPRVSRASDAKGVLEEVEEDGVINSVKGSREIKQGEVSYWLLKAASTQWGHLAAEQSLSARY